MVYLKAALSSWRNGSVVMSTGCSSIAQGFNFQHTHGDSQLVTPVTRDLTLFFLASVGTTRYTYTDTHTWRTPIHIKIKHIKDFKGVTTKHIK